MVDFTEMKPVFMQCYAGARSSFVGLPSLVPMTGFPHRNWRDAGPKNGLPNISIKLETLTDRLQEAYTVRFLHFIILLILFLLAYNQGKIPGCR